MHFPRTRVMATVVALMAAMALAVAGPLMGKFDNPICQAAGLVFSSGWAWAGFAFLVGFSRRSKIESPVLASSALAVAVVVYYVFKFVFPTAPVGAVISYGSGEETASKILVWGMAAFVFGAPVGLLGNLARTPGIGGLPFRLLIPLTAFFETSVRLETEAPLQGPVVEITWTAIRIAAGVALVALPVHTLVTWRARRIKPGAGVEVDALTKRR
ncbi:hypothetical protein PV721_33760 [Streptomyces sp. MB09-01]|uniref:hypothetical protein n=1 Tax=Streptomyces sp. MB09-01 TaxID=3028666 RepID=UPI0029AB49EA|nr:hypothetical protein [Streptomyces sp. MB09-01]MDX3539205.1 hypothetical protein [Streptomyces sp. MB09-01]